jgi:cellulose synthase/poly-beta-1,6-N-acetylglucosamine synthase-like glycosyltransferase
MLSLFHIVWWVSATAVVYIYFGYPILLAIFAGLSKKPSTAGGPLLPVSLLISAFNERLVIREKLTNSLALEYPPELLKILVISDSSDDGTDEIVRSFADRRVELIRQEPRKGKTAGLNLGVMQSDSQVIVFSDANAMYQPEAVKALTRHFSDPNVGYVVGNARYYEKGSDSVASHSEGLYWKLETFLKRQESIAGSVVGGDGAIYAIRRELYEPLFPTDINDFLNPLQIIAKGYKGVFDPEAVCYEETAGTFLQEYRRKVRIVSRSLNAVGRVPQVLNPLRHTRHWFFLISHKILRWFVPLFLIALLLSGFALFSDAIYKVLTLLQLAFYTAAFIGWKWQPPGRIGKLFSLPFYFCMVNLASLHGCIKCLRRDLSGQWNTPRQGVRDAV